MLHKQESSHIRQSFHDCHGKLRQKGSRTSEAVINRRANTSWGVSGLLPPILEINEKPHQLINVANAAKYPQTIFLSNNEFLLDKKLPTHVLADFTRSCYFHPMPCLIGAAGITNILQSNR